MLRLLLLFLVLVTTTSLAQPKVTVYRLNTTIVYADTVIQEIAYVTIASYRHEFCVKARELFCFRKFSRSIEGPGEFIAYCESLNGDKYRVRIVKGKDGFCMWLTNMNKKFPHVFIST